MPAIPKIKLAVMYYPDVSIETARKYFKSDLKNTPGLMESLRSVNYKKTQKVLKPIQVEVIYRFLGPP